MEKPKDMPLYIAIEPIGVYLQRCCKCKHDRYHLIDDSKYLACAKCNAVIAEYDPVYTAALRNMAGQEPTVH